jgi:hypothetical protein
MTETPARKPRPRRTFSVFGDVRRMPSEYEIITRGFQQVEAYIGYMAPSSYITNAAAFATADFLAEDARRRARWSQALADLAVAQRPDNRAVLAKWTGRWSALADDAALGLGTILETAAGTPAADVAAHARSARDLTAAERPSAPVSPVSRASARLVRLAS